ncbi:hypothetical protein Moror_13603 [Moniliophthora roreri MCA 2997]|uniref:F-box domain-containing protein n=1 Tax=Moniliophthora roreri (strain MCA 2997) TaxID=1381753 RepID=V2XCF3_MONRO|nr:hypothetical protein Moror_13603 [Moniliophthora roreri MCA 2997]KAI3618328.1 hypothetical protein WG66_005802 [Moniliophthora roreri]
MSKSRQSSRIKALLPQTITFDDSDDGEVGDGMVKAPKSRKRQKRDEDEHAPELQQGRRKKAKGNTGKLSLLPTMPLDILFEIFSNLPPKSLLALIDVNRAFRETFGGPIWATLKREYQAPDPPPGAVTSEIEWMKLLFGGSGCRMCTAKGVNLDWVLRKRLCRDCVSKVATPNRGFNQIYSGMLSFQTDKKLVLDLVLPTSSWNTMYYPHSQIVEVIREMAVRRAKGKKKGTMRVEVQKYATERKTYLEEWSKHNDVCAEWMKAQSKQRKLDAQQIGRGRIAAIEKRLLEMGYTQADLSAIRTLPCVRRQSPLTERSWKMIEDEVLCEIYSARTSRLSAANS